MATVSPSLYEMVCTLASFGALMIYYKIPQIFSVLYNPNYTSVAVTAKKIATILHSKLLLTSIFMAIMTTNGSPFCTCVPGVTGTFSITPGMGASTSSEKPDSSFDFRYDGMGRVRSYLPSYKVVKINFNEEIGGKTIMIIPIFIPREGSFVVRLCCH